MFRLGFLQHRPGFPIPADREQTLGDRSSNLGNSAIRLSFLRDKGVYIPLLVG